jgi:IclR family acetate operon transcriptional repressor
MANETATDRAPHPIRAVDRVCDVLEALRGLDGATLGEVALRTGLPKSSALRYLGALEARRYVERAPDRGTYRLGFAFRPERERVFELVRERATPILAKIHEESAESINIGFLDGTEVVFALVLESPHEVRFAAKLGGRTKIHCSSLGKAMAAHLPREQVRTILADSGMPAYTSETITDVTAFEAELELVRQVGYAMDERESKPDGRCVAVALDKLPFPAAVSLSAPAGRFGADTAPWIARQLRAVGDELTIALRDLPL